MKQYLEYNNWYPNQTTKAHMDVVLQICEFMHELTGNWSTDHVKGHQDRGNQTDLAWEAKLNIRSDELATEERNNLMKNVPVTKPVAYPASAINLFVGNELVTKRYSNAITRAWTTSDLRHYLE